VIGGIHLIKTLKNLSSISKTLKETVSATGADLKNIGAQIKESPIFSFIFGKKKKRKIKT